jgi:hypothetical protein
MALVGRGYGGREGDSFFGAIYTLLLKFDELVLQIELSLPLNHEAPLRTL